MAVRKTKKATTSKASTGLSDARFRENIEAMVTLMPSHSARVRMIDQVIGGRDYLAECEDDGRWPIPDTSAPAPTSGPPAGLKTTQTVKA